MDEEQILQQTEALQEPQQEINYFGVKLDKMGEQILENAEENALIWYMALPMSAAGLIEWLSET